MAPGMPLSVDQLLEMTPRVLSSTVGAPCHARPVASPELARDCPATEAAFLPRQRLALIHPSVVEQIGHFLDGRYTSGQLANERSELWQLGLVIGCVDALVHACCHGIGPANARLAVAEWDSYHQYPEVSVVSEGVAEALTAQLRQGFIRETGLLDRDPRIRDAQPVRRRFGAQADLVATVCREVARQLGTTYEQELTGLARDGAGRLATWRLALRWSAAQVYQSAELRRRPDAALALRNSLERTLSGLREDWVKVDGISAPFDGDIADLWSRSAVRDFADTIRRVKLGADQVPDLSVFAAALVAAAQAAESDVEQGLDQVSEALEMLMALGGDPGE